MRKVTYIGAPTLLARHGNIKSGDTIYMRESEWDTVKNDPQRFQLDSDTAELRDSSGVSVKPQKTNKFDLRTIHWSSRPLGRYLGRFNMSKLNKVAEAMNSLGLPVLCGRGCNAVDILDSIQHHAVTQGWDKLSRTDCLTSGTHKPRVRERHAAAA
jgi:hypothetical protein